MHWYLILMLAGQPDPVYMPFRNEFRCLRALHGLKLEQLREAGITSALCSQVNLDE